MNKEAQLIRANLIRLVISKPGRTTKELCELSGLGCRPQEMGQRLTKAGMVKVDGRWYHSNLVR